MIRHIDVMNWFNSQIDKTPNADAIRWVLDHWQEVHSASEAKISSSMLITINRQIKKISTGKQRAYRKALTELISYLSENLQWSIPEKEKRILQDAANKWFEDVKAQAANSERLINLHQKKLECIVKKTFEVNSAVLVVTLLLETAPITLPSIFYLLTHPDVLEIGDGQATICYPVSLEDKEQQNQYVRYKLSALSYRLLKDYFDIGNFPKNIRELRSSISKYLSSAPFYMENITDNQLLKMVTCYWQKQFPHFFVKDFINPSKQFALPPSRYLAANQPLKKSVKVKSNALFNSIVSLDINIGNKQKWPHKKLLKEYKKIGKKAILQQVEGEPQMVWSQDNILPQLYYLYVIELIKFGGVKADTLEISSIETYTSGDDYLNQHPLSFDNAISEDGVNSWANSFYENAESETVRLHLFYFLRFMAEQELTDALDIDAFQSVHLPKNVDANQVTVQELDSIIKLLLDCNPESKLQQLFCLVVVILSFHGCLRRGEILRLRMCDIALNEPKGSLFRITITRTSEGRPKNGKARVVHVELPPEQAKLLRLLLKIKDKAHHLDPLMGFSGELLSSRERQYILPVTRAIKSICGQLARFHHLRHGGAFVLTNQLINLFCAVEYTPSCRYLSELLQISFVKKRFSYWLENRPIELINSVVALDQVANMIGHSLFETTRNSYLHGHEWIIDYFTPVALQYSKAMLRYLLGLNMGSNDISRRIKLLLKSDCTNIQHSLHNNVFLFSSRVNEMVVNNAGRLSWLSDKPADFKSANLLNSWLINLAHQSGTSFDLLTQYYLKPSNSDLLLMWKELSQLKLLIYRNKVSLKYTKPTYKLINKLLQNIDIENHSFEVKLTKRDALNYKAVFELPEFSMFKRQFTLFKNAKTVGTKQQLFIEDQFFIGKEKLMVESLTTGKSKVLVKLELKDFSVKKLINLYKKIF